MQVKKDILEDIAFFLGRKRDFLCFLQILENEGSVGEGFECLNDKLSIIKLFFGDMTDFILSLKQFIFDVLDELSRDEISPDFKVSRKDFSISSKKYFSFFLKEK